MILAHLIALTLRPGVRYDDDWRMKIIRKYVRKRDRNRCKRKACGGKELHVHHKVPVNKGGSHSPRNLELICQYHHAMIHPWMET